MVVADPLGHDVKSLSIHRTRLHPCRQRIPKETAETWKCAFGKSDLLAPIIHWDGKFLPSLTGMENLDRHFIRHVQFPQLFIV